MVLGLPRTGTTATPGCFLAAPGTPMRNVGATVGGRPVVPDPHRLAQSPLLAEADFKRVETLAVAVRLRSALAHRGQHAVGRMEEGRETALAVGERDEPSVRLLLRPRVRLEHGLLAGDDV